MKTNESGAEFGTIGRERSKRLATAVVFAMVLAGLAIVTSEVEMSEAEPQGNPVTTYEELLTAFTTGGTYYLANDITIESASGLNVTASVVLDLNGSTLNKTYAAQNNFIIKINGGSLTINDSGADGKIVSVDYGIQLYSGSSLTINDGAIETDDESVDIRTSAKNVSITIAGGSIKSTNDNVLGIRGDENIDIEITGGTMVSNGRTAVYVSSYEENAITISMTGGSIEHHDGRSGAFQIYSGANVTIGGDAEVSSDNRTLILQAGESQSTLNITGGTISSTGRGSAVISTEDNAKLNISGGTFEATSNKVISATEDSAVTIDGVGIEISGEMEDNATLIINEGASASIADGFEMESNNKITNNGTLDVKGEITGATATNLTGAGIVLGYEGEGFTDSTKVEGTSINANAQNFEQVMASINDNPDMYAGVTTVSVNEGVTIDDVLNVPAGIDLSFGENTISTTTEGNGIVLQNGASFTGVISMGSATVTADGLVSAGELSILHGSIVFGGDAGSGSAVLTSTDGEDIILTGTLETGVQITIVQGSDAVNVPVRFDNFNDNGGTVGFQSFGSEEVSEDIPSWIEAIYAGNVTLGGLTITNDAVYTYNGTSQYPSKMLASVSGMASQGFINKTLNGLATGGSDMGVYKFDGVSLVQTDAIDAGTYYVYYGYFVDGLLHAYLCEWTMQTVNVDIAFSSIDKTYDGTVDLESGDSVTVPTVPNIIFGTPVYEDMNAGEDKAVILTVGFQNGTDPGNYTFAINGQEATILGDAENGYYFELQGSISKKEITVSVSAELEYSGEVFEHAYGDPDFTGVDGDYLTGTVVTNGSDAKAYSGAGLTYSNIVIKNGETDVTRNYVVTYDVDNTLTILPKKVTVSPAGAAEITKVYNGYSSRIMEETDFQMTGVIEGDDVSFTWTNSSIYVKYNSSNVSEADTLTVTGISLTGNAVGNYELTSTEVVFEDGVNGITVGITPLVLSFTGKDAASVDKTYDGTVVAPVEDIMSDDYTVSESQSGTQPTVSVTSAVYDSADAGIGKTVYITGIELSNNDNGNFALPEMQTSDDISYYFFITGEGVKIDALTITFDMIGYDIAEVDGQIVLTLTVSYEDLVLTDFTSTLKLGETDVTGTNNSYPISSAGTYTATVTSNDSNWSGIGVSKTITIEFTYVANFYTKKTIDGEYSIEQSVTGDKQIQTPNATNVPSGYVLAGWALEPNVSKAYGVNVFADVSPVNTDFYAVYEEDSGTPVGPEPGTEPQVTIDMPSEFVLGEQTEFSVSTVANGYSGNVKGTGVFEGIQGVDYVIQYYEIQDGQWYDWTSGEFGPSDGFPMADDTSKFRVTFLNAGTYALTVQIVTADTGEVVCETTTTVEVVAAHSLDYYINAALDYQYTGESKYEYKGDLSYVSGDIVVVYGPEYGEILQEIIGMIESGDTSGAYSKIGELKDIKDDYVRYMGALHWQGTGVSSVAWNSTTYTWDDSLTTKGSRWTSESGTLSANINTYIIGQYLAGNFTLQISMELSNGAEREMFTYSVQFEEAPAPEVQYFDVTLSGEGVAFYIDGLRYDAGTYAFAEGEHRISIEILNGYEGTPFISNVEDGMFTVSGEMTIEVTGISAVEVPVEAPYLSVVLPGVVYVGDEIDFSVTSNGQYSNNVFSKYETDAADGTYTVWYIENAGSLAGQPVELGNGDLFGPQNTGYPYTDGATSSFRVVFNAPGTYVFTISVVDADDTSEVVCSKMTYITVVSAPVVAESFDVVIGSETAIVRSEGQSVGLPSVYEGRPVSGWQVGDKTYSGVYVVDATDAVDGTITLTPVYEGDEYDVAVTLTDTEHASHSGVVKSGDVFYITVETDVGYSITGYTASQGDSDLPIAVVASYGHTVTLMVTVSGYEDVAVNIVVEQNAVSENIDVTIESHMDGAYITIDANSDYAYLPTSGTITVTYYWSVIGTDGFVTMSSETTTAQVVTTDGETGLTHLIVELGDEASYGDSADAGHYLNGDAYAIVAQYQYGETTVVSNTETEVYVS